MSNTRSANKKHARDSEANAPIPAPSATDRNIPENDCDVVIEIWGRSGGKHRLNWTHLLERAPDTCLRRLLDARGEKVHLHQPHANIPEYFVEAVCEYAKRGSCDPLDGGSDWECIGIARVLSDLLFLPCIGEMKVADRIRAGIVSIQSGEEITAKLKNLKNSAATLLYDLMNSHSTAVLDVVHLGDFVTIGFDVNIDLDTDKNTAELVRRFYATLKLLGVEALDYPDVMKYKVVGTPGKSGYPAYIDARVWNVRTHDEGSTRMYISFKVLIKAYEIVPCMA